MVNETKEKPNVKKKIQEFSVIYQMIEDFKIQTIKYEDIKKIKKFSEGAQAKVYSAEYQGNLVAVKELMEIDMKCLINELAILSKLNHSNIPKFYGLFIDKEKQMIGYVLQLV